MTDSRARRLAFATIANFAFFVGVTAFFTLPVRLQALNASRAEIGRVMGVFGLASLFAIPATGALVDRYGRRPFVIAGCVVWSLVALLFARVETMSAWPYALRFLHGLSFSLVFVSTNALIVELAPPGGLGRAIAVFGTTTLAAHAVGPSVGEWVAHRWGFALLFSVAGAFGVLALFGFLRAGDSGAVAADADAEPIGMARLALRRGGRGVLLGGLSTALAFGAAINFVPVFVRARGLPSHAPFFIAYVVSAVGVRLFAGGLGDRVGHRRVGIVAALLFSVAVASLGAVHGVGLLVLLALIFGAGHGFAYPSMNALFVQDAPPWARGRAMALFNLAFNIGMTLAAFLAGELSERFGYGVMFGVLGAAASLGALAVALDRPIASDPA
ncbi:MAG: MFS transporter [Myxococcales bacterium]|nr:MFS transporter [Myxococcales bacterium]MCB9577551.1 MFS transporter [Polyangiaceae bacterium]